MVISKIHYHLVPRYYVAVPSMHLVLILNLATSLILSNMCLGMMLLISILSAMLTSVGNRVERRLSIYDS